MDKMLDKEFKRMGKGYSSVLEHLSSMCGALNSVLRTIRNRDYEE
jgi:hypothetical protein